jgi:hypothetical protein
MKSTSRTKSFEASIPQMDAKGQIDFESVNQLSQEQMTEWMTLRLQGYDSLCPPDEREGAAWQDLIAAIYGHRRVTDETCRRIRRALFEIGSLFTRWPVSRGWHPFAIEAFFDLASEVFAESREMGRMARLVLRSVHSLPWTAKGRNSATCDLKAAALQCLIDLDYREKPEVWEARWGQGRHPEIVGLVFEGIQRSAGYPAAFRWIGRARPWNPEYVFDALDARWGQLLHDCRGQEMLIEIIASDMLTGMDPISAQQLAEWLNREKQTILKMKKIVTSSFGCLAEIVKIAAIKPMLAPNKKEGLVTITYESSEQEIMDKLGVIYQTMVEQNPTLEHYNIREISEAAMAATIHQPQLNKIDPAIALIRKNVHTLRKCA